MGRYKDICTARVVRESYGFDSEQKLFKCYCLGTQGIAVTFVAQGEEDRLFRKMEEKIGNKIDTLPGIDNLM